MSGDLVRVFAFAGDRRIIVGGSVRKGGQLGEERFFARLRADFRKVLAGYISLPSFTEAGIAEFIVPPQLGDDAGVCGALALAHDAAKTEKLELRSS